MFYDTIIYYINLLIWQTQWSPRYVQVLCSRHLGPIRGETRSLPFWSLYSSGRETDPVKSIVIRLKDLPPAAGSIASCLPSAVSPLWELPLAEESYLTQPCTPSWRIAHIQWLVHGRASPSPLPQGRKMLRGHSRYWASHSYCWSLCCNSTAVHLFLLPNSLYFTHHNCCSQEHPLINPLYTNLTVAGKLQSKGTWHTTHGSLNELHFSLSALSSKFGCNGSLRYTVLQVGKGNSIFLCMDSW